MKKLLLLSASVVSGLMVIHTVANADTNLIYNKDTGANIAVDADNEIVDETSVNTQTTNSTSVMAESDSPDSDETRTEARGGVMVESDLNTETEVENASGESDTRIQQLDDRTDAGVQATATTEVDVR